MRIKLSQFARQQRVFISLTASTLLVTQYQRRFTRWFCLHDAEIVLSEKTQDLSEVLIKLKELMVSWGIPDGTWVSWILPSDIVGVLRYSKQSNATLEIASLFPFDISDLKLSEFSENKETPQTIFWTHKDWVGEVVKVSKQVGWACDELYSRAQLFQTTLPSHAEGYSLLMEGDASEQYLHIFSPNGAVVRTTKVSMSHSADMPTALRKEIGSLSVQGDKGFRLFSCNLPSVLVQPLRIDFEFEQLPDVNAKSLVFSLLGSMATGIELQPTYATVANRINAYSLAFAIVGSILLGIMVWHDGVLQSEIETQRRQVRKDTSAFQVVKAMRLETVKMANAIMIKQTMVSEPSAFRPLAELLPVISPPMSLTFYEQSGSAVRIAGANDNGVGLKSSLEKNPKFSSVRMAQPKEGLAKAKGAFAFELRWQESDSSVRVAEVQKAVK